MQSKLVWNKELQYKTIGDCLQERVKKTPDHIAVEFEGQTITWRELDCLSDWLVLRFRFFGMKKGSRAALWCGNHMQWVIVYFGLQKIGALTVLINPGYQVDEFYSVLSYAQIEYLFYGETFKGKRLSHVLEQIDLKMHPYLKQTIPIELQDAIDFMRQGAEAMTKADRNEVQELAKKVTPEDIACMLFTSGTTALPKGVMLTHYSLINDAAATVHAMRWNETDKTCVMVPLFHCFGMTSCLLAGLLAGNSLYLMKQYRTVTALAAIEEAGCTILNGVPSMFLAMIHNRAFTDYDIHTLKSGIIAGSSISPGDYKKICEKLQIKNLQMSYGQTETSPGVSFSAYGDSIENKCDNAGYFVDHIDVCIWEKDGTQHIYLNRQLQTAADVSDNRSAVCPPFHIHGEIGIRGFLVMQYYYNLPEETKKVLGEDGWLHTGDLGYIDEKKQLHIEGRLKEMIIRGGENISPIEIEECIRGIPGIRQVKVIGVPQAIIQEEIVACVEVKDGCTMTEKEIREYVETHLAQYKVPKYIQFFEKLPMNASGKIMTGELKKQITELLNLQICKSEIEK